MDWDWGLGSDRVRPDVRPSVCTTATPPPSPSEVNELSIDNVSVLFSASKMASGVESVRRPPWLIRKIEGVLIDITGVLYNSSEEGGEVIPGSVHAIER